MKELMRSKKPNVFCNVYSYSVEYNSKFNHWRVNEYKDGKFYADHGEYRSRSLAVKRMNEFLTAGGTAVSPV